MQSQTVNMVKNYKIILFITTSKLFWIRKIVPCRVPSNENRIPTQNRTIAPFISINPYATNDSSPVTLKKTSSWVTKDNQFWTNTTARSSKVWFCSYKAGLWPWAIHSRYDSKLRFKLLVKWRYATATLVLQWKCYIFALICFQGGDCDSEKKNKI